MRGWNDCPRCAGTGSGQGFRMCGLRPLRLGDHRPEAPVVESLPEHEKVWRVQRIRVLAEECCPDAGAFLVGIALGEWVGGQLSDEVILETVRKLLGECRKYTKIFDETPPAETAPPEAP